ncbi:MAG TPA: hypothetical protein VNG90_02095 [Candidatus Acidoferrum sp.]|nr:hypothetical protein [Candidatus Acidoferrum sp.]
MFFIAIIWLAIMAIALGIIFFELFMFLDVIRNKKLTDTEKLLWGIGMLLFHPIIAIAYFIVVYSKKK